MKKFTYQNKEYDFLYNSDDEALVDRHDKADRKRVAAMQELNDKELTQVEQNRELAHVFCNYIDETLGDGTCNAVFGAETTLNAVRKMGNTLFNYIVECMKEERSAVEKPQLNREQRRAKH